jgi:glutamate-ammonia-ligase adenylyltransferase
MVQELGHAILVSVDPTRAVNHLLRYLDCLPQPAALWQAWHRRPHGIASTITLLAGSQFLTSILWRRPQLLVWLLEDALWAPPPGRDALQEELQQLLHGKASEAEVGDCLRAFTHQHLLRIGGRDLNNLAGVEEITADLSVLADCVVQVGLQTCQRWLDATDQPFYTDDAGNSIPATSASRYGQARRRGTLSSDIDLMYVYTSYRGQTTGVQRDGAVHADFNHECFVALSRRLTNLIGGKGPDGQAFVSICGCARTAHGATGPVAPVLQAYYARLGQTWERWPCSGRVL